MFVKILAVDDDTLVTSALNTLFKIEGIEDYALFNSPNEAVEWLKTNKPSVIISDFMMPEMNGLEFLKKAKEIYISKYGSDDRTESDFEYIKNALLYSKIDDYPELTELYTMYKLNEIIDGEPGERLNPAVKAFSDGYIRAMKQLGR